MRETDNRGENTVTDVPIPFDKRGYQEGRHGILAEIESRGGWEGGSSIKLKSTILAPAGSVILVRVPITG